MPWSLCKSIRPAQPNANEKRPRKKNGSPEGCRSLLVPWVLLRPRWRAGGGYGPHADSPSPASVMWIAAVFLGLRDGAQQLHCGDRGRLEREGR